MRYRLFLCLALLSVLLVSGCQGPPPTQYVLVVTATPLPAGGAATSETPAETQQVAAAVTGTATTSPTPSSSATPDSRPTATVGQIQVAEQVFEHGRMLWIQPRRQIWVMIDSGEGRGKWLIFDDTFTEGEPESDPDLTPPPGKYQPERGFGKLWRTNQEVNDALGWGVTPEFGYVSNYEYHPGGTVDALAPGYHILFSLYQERFRFNEADGTWQKE
ncbi:MAG: hypothetical protein HZC41_15860 [Chloroflexi bacterium]|nr:hypothetical protein [Chloroflexota bacterium]